MKDDNAAYICGSHCCVCEKRSISVEDALTVRWYLCDVHVELLVAYQR
jgi:hypothetical protein